MSATRTHPKDALTYELSLQDKAFFLPRLFGLSERPSVIVGNRVSIWFRLYSGLIATLAFGFTVQNISSVMFPSRSCSPMISDNFSAAQRSVYPLWCTMCALLRISVSYSTLSQRHARELDQASRDLQCEACLSKFWRPSTKHMRVINVGSLFGFSFLILVNACMYVRYSAEPLSKLAVSPLSYVFLLETVVFASSFLGNLVFLGIISVGLLTRMFRFVEGEVEEWTKYGQKSEEVLKEVMERHNRCWRLTDLYDKVFRNVLGSSFLFCVPIFCMVTTQVVKIYTERRGDDQLISRILYMMLWSFSCISFTSLVCGFASSVNTAAAAPRKHLMRMSDNHNIRILHFLARLSDCNIGFTFFDFFVIEKTTILTIFSLMITYLVVFLQMAQVDTTGSP